MMLPFPGCCLHKGEVRELFLLGDETRLVCLLLTDILLPQCSQTEIDGEQSVTDISEIAASV